MDSYEDVTKVSQWDRPVSSMQSLNNRAQSTSCLDLNRSTPDMETLRSLLPSYRQAPDYETAVQQKYRNSSGAIATREPIRNAHPILYSSQPEIHQAETFAPHLCYPDVTHNNIEQKNLLYSSGFAQSQILSNETRPRNVVDMTDNIGMLHLYKPPPPYPSNRISSNSTPDLAGISQHAKPQNHFINNLVSGSSPDLVSTSNFYIKPYGQLYADQAHPIHRSQSFLPPQHGTYENLASIFNNNMRGRPQAVIVENPNITKHIKKVYDEHGNIIYCMPANMKQILQENQLPSTGFVVTRNQNAMVAHDSHLNNSTEPIYENIPLPWQNDNTEMRARTQSIHSAPEISQASNLNVIQSQLQQMNLNTAQGSKENLYANINHNNSAKSSKTELNVHPPNNLNESNRSSKNLNSSNVSSNVSINRNESPSSINRVNTFVNKNSSLNTTGTSSFADNSTVSNETFTDTSSASNTSSTKSKKKRWGILMGRTKSSEKIKSATLGREKEKKDKVQMNNKHRWSTGLPRYNPLPPSISKETMVSCV